VLSFDTKFKAFSLSEEQKKELEKAIETMIVFNIAKAHSMCYFDK
jgi:hypothetical protein